ncbi:MAG: glycosyltransferase family 2 protein [Candidatus Microgenomates bacterium]|jgi:glycosyltransferase involved in cell wall biosynthesis
MKIFIVISLFNEEKHILKVVKDFSFYKLPVIIVDDGSTDNSRSKIIDSGLKNVTFLTHKVNLGKGAAMKTGAEYAFSHGADAVVFVDADGQHSANDLPKFIKALESGKYDVVFGSRNFSFGVPMVRFLGNKIASVVLSILFGIYISDVLCGFKALTKKAYKSVRWDSIGYGVETEMVARTGMAKLPFCEVPVELIYHDKVKGVTILDAFGVFGEIIKWKIIIK